MRDRNGDPVAPEDVLAADELEAYYRGRRWPPPSPGAVSLPWPETAAREAAEASS